MKRSDIRIRKVNLDRRTAVALGVRMKQVAAVTAAFLNEVRLVLADEGVVVLDGLGQLRVVRRVSVGVTGERTSKTFVSFTKSDVLTATMRRAKEEAMDKFGVDESGTDLEKKAAEGCPECGQKPTKHGNILMCPTHGSEPFEPKEKSRR
jgi:hypothetical protein